MTTEPDAAASRRRRAREVGLLTARVPPAPFTRRPAARVVCLDASGCVLLLHWRDPTDGRTLWEPPGGGIGDGETPLQAARRELAEETGLDPAAIVDGSVDVERDFVWRGRRYGGTERFFLAHIVGSRPRLSRAGLMADEHESLLGHDWVPLNELAGIRGLEPPGLADIVTRLTVGGAPPAAQ